MKEATNFFLHTCLSKPSPSQQSQQEHEKPSSTLTTSMSKSRRFFASTTATSLFPSTRFTSHESLPSLEDAFTQFIESYPQYSNSYKIDEIRGQEYQHLSLTNRVCLDYFGIGLFAYSQFNQHRLPHPAASTSSSPAVEVQQPSASDSPLFSMLYRSVNLKQELLSSSHESKLESAIKNRIRDFLSISADDYSVVLTANRTAAFKLLAESYPFQSHRNLLTVYDHQSEAVEAMTSTSVKRGAKPATAEFTFPRLRIRSTKLKNMLISKTNKKKKGLFVFQLQSRVTGSRYRHQWMHIAQENGWHVVLDACALGPKDMDSLGLSLLQPDFVISSFYKVFGDDPTGFGCLFVKKTAIPILLDSKTSGIVSIIPANRFLHPIDSASESEPEEVHTGISSNSWCALHQFKCLDHVDSLGLTLINARVRYLTNWLINALTKLKHGESEKGGVPLVRVYGPKIRFDRGAAVAFNVFDWAGERVDPVLVQRLGDRKGITVGQGWLRNLWFEGRYEGEKGKEGVKVVTVAVGLLVNFQDVYRLWVFIARFLDADFVEKERCRYTAVTHSG